jgi:hypothetical protein
MPLKTNTMKTIALYIALAAMVCSCAKNESMLVRPDNSGTASIHYSRSLNDASVYYFAVRSADAGNDAKYSWSVNGKVLSETGQQFQYKFSQPGQYSIRARVNNEPVSQTIIVAAQ